MKLVDVISDVIGKVVGFTSDHAEELCAAGAIAASVGGVVLAVKVTNDIREEVDDINADIDDVEFMYDEEDGTYELDERDEDDNIIVLTGNEAYREYKRDLMNLKIEKAKLYTRNYWKVAALEIASAALTIAGDRIGRQHQAEIESRYLETAAKLTTTIGAVTSLQKSFDQYRENVKERYGEEADRDMMQGITRTSEKIKVKGENGRTKTVEVESETRDPNKISSRWTRCFDEASKNWKKDAFRNVDFLRSAESVFNENLKWNGYVTVNQIYEWLDVPQCPDGQTWGWIYDPDYIKQIDFGLMDIYDPAKRGFINGYERNVWIEFLKEPRFIGDVVWGERDGDMNCVANRHLIGRGCH